MTAPISSFSKIFSFLHKTKPVKASGLQDMWRKYLNDTTEKMAGVDPSKATIICLGDVHDEEWQNNWRGTLIDHYGSDGDIVLCEGHDAMQELPKSSRFTAHKAFSYYGWDNLDICRQQRDASISMMKSKEKYKHTSFSQWSKEDQETWQLLSKGVEAFTYIRTHELVKTAKIFVNRLKPGQKLFIVAGSDHLFYKCNEPALKYEFNTVDALKPHASALILPKEMTVKTQEDQNAYLKTLENK